MTNDDDDGDAYGDAYDDDDDDEDDYVADADAVDGDDDDDDDYDDDDDDYDDDSSTLVFHCLGRFNRLSYITSTINCTTWWRHQMETFSRYWPFVRGIHRWPVNSPHKGQWRWALMFSLICAWINGWLINREAIKLIMTSL